VSLSYREVSPGVIARRDECTDCGGTGRDDRNQPMGYCHYCDDGIVETYETQCSYCGEYWCQCDDEQEAYP
jgi:hypothetical protein